MSDDRDLRTRASVISDRIRASVASHPDHPHVADAMDTAALIDEMFTLVDRLQTERDEMLAALISVVNASQLPAECVHGEEVDYCDGCAFVCEKTLGAALSTARRVIDKAEGR